MRTTASTAASTTSRTREEPHVGARSNTEPSANPGGQLGKNPEWQRRRSKQAESADLSIITCTCIIGICHNDVDTRTSNLLISNDLPNRFLVCR